MLKVRKREGDIVDFDAQKILNAVSKAYKEKDIPFWGTKTEDFYRDWIDISIVRCDRKEGDNIIDIETIQDMVQKQIILRDYSVGLAYIKYRFEKNKDRKFGKELFDFVENYKGASNTANATIDDNSNVSNKNVGVLNAEIHKKNNIKGNRFFETNKLKELFPNTDLHKQYLKDLASHIFYKNDENSFPFPVPYTYSAKEVVSVKYKGKTLCCALDTLYGLVDEKESLLNKEDNAYAKYPVDLYVKDKEGWTNIERMIRKERRRDLVRVKTAFGEDVVVTDNHPMIVNDNIDDNVQAIDSLGQKQLRISQNIEFGGKDELDLASVLDYAECYENFLLFQHKEKSQYNGINRHLKLDRDFGYVVGFFIGDGHYNNNNGGVLSFTQKERETLEQLADKLWKSCGIITTIGCKKDKNNCWYASVHSQALVSLFRNVFKIKDYAQNKNLPIDIFEYNKDFALGILEGLVDSDGSIEANSQVSIRLSSRECICQLAVLVKEFGFGASMFTQNTPFSNNIGMIHQNYTIWGIRFANTPKCTKLTNSYKWRNNITREIESGLKYKDGWSTITSVDKIENGSFLLQNKFIYDITTKTHSFVSNNLFVHNCMAGSMYPFFLHGLMQLGGKSTRPKSLHSFCGLYINFVFSLSGMFAGAVALPETLIYFDYYARKEWGDEYYKYSDKIITAEWLPKKMSIKQQIHQHFQNIIHSINQPSGARGQQSVFVNFSIFDKAFFEGMFGNFYFDSETMEQPKWESVQWLQECFMEWFNAERLRTMLTFPVVSVTLLTTKDGFDDERMANFVCKEWEEGDSFFVYLSNSVDSLSSCCFKGNELITINKNGEEQTLTIETFVNEYTNAINQQGISIKTDSQIISYNKETQEQELANIDGVLKKEYSGKMFTFEVGDKSIKVTADHLMLVQDVNTNEILEVRADKVFENKEQYLIAVESKDVCFDKITNCKEEVVSNEVVYDIQLDKNHYFSANGIITHNCRLKNKLQTKEFNFTNGNMGVETGSKSVISLNLSRIMQNFFREVIGDTDAVVKDRISIIKENWEKYKDFLGEILERVYKYHIAYNENLFDFFNAKLLPSYDAGIIDLNKQYLTIGLNGLNQSAEFLGMTCNDNKDYEWYCQNLFGFIKEMNTAHNGMFNGHKLTFNTEQVPAESLAVKNYNWDKEDGYWTPTDTNLYASYVFKPNDPNTQILEKIRLHGDRFIGDYLDGGSACHLNLDSHLSKAQYMHLLNYARENGCSYLTFNVPNSECQDCGYITKHPIKECPKCGSNKIDYYDRVIGYLTKIKAWSQGRQIEQGLRVYEEHTNDYKD